MRVQRLLLISGPIAVGKSSVAKCLTDEHGFSLLRSSGYLKQQLQQSGVEQTRKNLQDFGDSLDLSTDFQWVVDKVAIPTFAKSPEIERWLFDSVRKEAQVTRFRQRFLSTLFHAHFTAPEEVLRNRFSQRQIGGQGVDLGLSYENASSHPNEVASRALSSVADIVVDLQAFTASRAALLVVEAMAQGENRDRDCPN